MKIIDTVFSEVKLIEPRVFGDERGFFLESWNQEAFADAGLQIEFVQDNHSQSSKGVLRGLHYQITKPQGKLIRVVSGRAWDVVVDLRKSSPWFGKWAGFELTADNKHLLWIPPGFAHGFLALEDQTDLIYKCTNYYAPEFERSILWSDPAIGIEWPLERQIPRLSDKDANGKLLIDAEIYS
ncbi:dTDP-4-dehydrorhamnose 3,5-epimerase [Sphingorhabdus sp.]|uniref:dTDP-4-dehydrorhamnose 3,5-epimerase n=1 Tax=Sphingorhabdus sp. TaxID=1902408 RepID=UPI0035AF5261